jgi:hypothetical protein
MASRHNYGCIWPKWLITRRVPDPQGGWQREIRAALERMQRLGKRLGDKTMQQYKDIMAQASQVLK